MRNARTHKAHSIAVAEVTTLAYDPCCRSLDQPTFMVREWLCGRVPDLQSGGCGFESQPGILRTKVYSAFHPSGSVNEYRYQLRLGRQRQVWLIPIADERVGVQVKL